VSRSSTSRSGTPAVSPSSPAFLPCHSVSASDPSCHSLYEEDAVALLRRCIGCDGCQQTHDRFSLTPSSHPPLPHPHRVSPAGRDLMQPPLKDLGWKCLFHLPGHFAAVSCLAFVPCADVLPPPPQKNNSGGSAPALRRAHNPLPPP
jgi:hypothetical protein